MRFKTPEFSCEVIKCCVALHNLLIRFYPNVDPPDVEQQVDDDVVLEEYNDLFVDNNDRWHQLIQNFV